MQKILLTGAGGFIASHVGEALLQAGWTVVGIDEMNDAYPVRFKEENITLLSRSPKFRLIRADFCDQKIVHEIFETERFTHVAHLGARAGVRPSIQNPYLYETANIQGTLNLLEAAARSKVQNFVLTSSSSVYGNSKTAPFREDDSATDRPVSQYAATKKSCEVLAYTYHHLYGLPVNVIRPFTVYGPRGRPDMAPWLFVDWAFQGKPIRKFGDGTSQRDYTYVEDFVAGFIAAIERPLGYEIFNLGNAATVSLNDFLAVVSETTGRELRIEQHPDQPGDVMLTSADISKAKRLLDYHPRTSIRQGMEKFVEWFKKTRLSGGEKTL